MKYLTLSSILLIFLVNSSLSANRDYDLVYDETQVLDFHIAITPENWQKMQPSRSSPEQKRPRRLEFGYVPATVQFGDEIYEDVGIRFKASSSYTLAPDRYKKPFKLDFDRFVDKQHFHGFKKLNFHTNASDPTMMREKLSYDLFRKAGVPAARATFVKLYLTIDDRLDDAYLGVYTSVEQIGGGLLRKHFDDAKGLFVKRIAGGDFTYAGEDWEAYENQFELRSKPKKSNTTALIKFIKLLRQASNAEFDREIENRLDIDKLRNLHDKRPGQVNRYTKSV